MDRYSVLHVIDALGVGGAERVMVDSCNILHHHGIEVSVLVLTKSEELAQYLDPEIAYLNLNRTNKWSPLKLIELNRICRQFDIVHVHLRYNLKYVGLSKLFFGGKFELVLHDHFGDIEKDQQVPFGLAFFMHRAWFVGVHPLLAHWAMDKVGISKDKVFVLPNIVVKSESNNITKKDGDQLLVLIVSNFRDSKNLIFAIDLIEHLSRIMQIKVDIIGKVVELDCYRQIEQMILNKGLSEITHLNHEVSNAQEEFGKYDMALHTARLESGPLVLLEYLAHGLPFLAYNTGEISRKLSPHFPHFFLDNFSVNNWATALVRMRERDQQKLKLEMTTFFSENFGAEEYYTAYQKVYESVMEAETVK